MAAELKPQHLLCESPACVKTNCLSAINKAIFIPALATHSALHVLAQTETRILPENTANSGCSTLQLLLLPHPLLYLAVGGFPNFQNLEIYSSPCSLYLLCCHALIVTNPAKLHIVIYHPPGPLGNTAEETDMLVSSIPDDGLPNVILGKPDHSPQKTTGFRSPCPPGFI